MKSVAGNKTFVLRERLHYKNFDVNQFNTAIISLVIAYLLQTFSFHKCVTIFNKRYAAFT